MSIPAPSFHGDGFDADWVSSVLLKNNWKDYYGNDWGSVAANIKKLAHNDPPYPLPNADAGVYEMRLWAWKVLTMEKYALFEHPEQLLNITHHFTVTGKMLREMVSATSVWLRLDVDRGVTNESRELASHAIWEWVEKGKSHERKWQLTDLFKSVFWRTEDTKQRAKDIKDKNPGSVMVGSENMDDEEDELMGQPPAYTKS